MSAYTYTRPSTPVSDTERNRYQAEVRRAIEECNRGGNPAPVKPPSDHTYTPPFPTGGAQW